MNVVEFNDSDFGIFLVRWFVGLLYKARHGKGPGARWGPWRRMSVGVSMCPYPDFLWKSDVLERGQGKKRDEKSKNYKGKETPQKKWSKEQKAT